MFDRMAGQAIRLTVAIEIDRCGNGRLDTKRPRDPRDFLLLLGAIDEHFFFRRLVVGDALERDMRHQPADLFPFAVLSALVDEPT